MSWWSEKRLVVTGGHGFLGRRIVAMAAEKGADVFTFGSHEYDLTRQEAVRRLYEERRPDVVIHAAARVGGIGANQENPGRFFYENAIMGIELIEQARQFNVEKFVQIGTVCAYPKFTPVPFSEDDLWDGYPEETNAPYGIAKKALLVQAQAYRQQYGLNAIFLLPANLYGPADNFDPSSSHVIPALIRKCVDAADEGAPSIEAWGTGTPTREFLYVDDAARGILMATELYDEPDPVNLGTSDEVSIRALTEMIAELTGYRGDIVWNPDRPDGQPRRKLSTQLAFEKFGFRAIMPLREGLRETVDWYRGQRNLASADAHAHPLIDGRRRP